MQQVLAVIGLFIGGVILIIGLAVLFSIPTWLLWNWLMPIIFGLKAITILQALGLNILCGILFKASSTSK